MKYAVNDLSTVEEETISWNKVAEIRGLQEFKFTNIAMHKVSCPFSYTILMIVALSNSVTSIDAFTFVNYKLLQLIRILTLIYLITFIKCASLTSIKLLSALEHLKSGLLKQPK
ncbi:hypothetical protein QTN25_006313 [Entamoeba marina]